MKPPSRRNISNHNDISRPPPGSRAVYSPRSYPSLSDSGEPYFPLDETTRPATRSATDTSSEAVRLRIPYIRAFSFLAIVAVIVALAVNG